MREDEGHGGKEAHEDPRKPHDHKALPRGEHAAPGLHAAEQKADERRRGHRDQKRHGGFMIPERRHKRQEHQPRLDQ